MLCMGCVTIEGEFMLCKECVKGGCRARHPKSGQCVARTRDIAVVCSKGSRVQRSLCKGRL